MNKVLVLLSGGMDSTTLLHLYVQKGYAVTALSFNYGQRHERELSYAAATAEALGIPHSIMNIDQVFEAFESQSSLLFGEEVPDGHYAEDVMKKTVVPNRNMILLSIAAGYAVSKEIPILAYAAHSGDHTIYPDCRPTFVNPLREAMVYCDWFSVHLVTPFIHLTKGEVAAIGNFLNLDYATTWSCYKGEEEPCGVCGTCTERLEALEQAKTLDGADIIEQLNELYSF